MPLNGQLKLRILVYATVAFPSFLATSRYKDTAVVAVIQLGEIQNINLESRFCVWDIPAESSWVDDCELP